jgi:hypothetical protein
VLELVLERVLERVVMELGVVAIVVDCLPD